MSHAIGRQDLANIIIRDDGVLRVPGIAEFGLSHLFIYSGRGLGRAIVLCIEVEWRIGQHIMLGIPLNVI